MSQFHESFKCCMPEKTKIESLFLDKISSQVAKTLNGVNASLALKYRNQGEGGKHKIDQCLMSSPTYRKIIFRKGNFNEFKIDLTFLRVVCLSLHLIE